MKTLLLTDPEKAAQLLKNGEVVALPTETVYGLAGNATDGSIVKKIFEAKERPSFDPLIVHISETYLKSNRILDALVNNNIIDSRVFGWKTRTNIETAMKAFWPGPLTIILPKGIKIPNEVTSNQDTVGIRCPKHPMFQKVLAELSFPLAAPSANRFGRISPTSAEHVIKELDGRIAGILDGGECEVGVESTIIKVEEDTITLLRPGKISKSELESVFQTTIKTALSLMQTLNQTAVTPGSLDEHYAPKKPLFLLPVSFLDPKSERLISTYPDASLPSTAFLTMSGFSAESQPRTEQTVKILSAEKSVEEMARNLFSAMRELDENESVSIIFSDSPPSIKEGLGASIFDRLKRASRNKPTPI